MPKIEREVTINAPKDKVFAYLTDPKNQLEWMPGLSDVRDVSGKGQGCKFGWTYKMVGIPIKGQSEYIEYVPDSRCVINTTGGVASKWAYQLTDQGGKTNLKLTVDYDMPASVVGKMAGPVITRQNEREATLGMSNIKERLEA